MGAVVSPNVLGTGKESWVSEVEITILRVTSAISVKLISETLEKFSMLLGFDGTAGAGSLLYAGK